jgi:hypothetical protein
MRIKVENNLRDQIWTKFDWMIYCQIRDRVSSLVFIQVWHGVKNEVWIKFGFLNQSWQGESLFKSK